MTSVIFGIARFLKHSTIISNRIIVKNRQLKLFPRLCSSLAVEKKTINDECILRYEDKHITVKGPSWDSPIDLPFMWLRDHCRCSKCYEHTTNQRLLDLLSIHEKIRPSECKIKDGILTVVWPDDHRSEYTMDWLWNNTYEGYTSQLKTGTEKGGTPIMWDCTPESRKGIAKVPFAKYMASGIKGTPKTAAEASEGLIEVVKSIMKYGVAFVDGVPPTIEGTQSVVNQLALIQHTYFGGMFEFGDSMTHMDTAYTSQYIGAHNDNTYFKEAAGLLVLHCVHHEGIGGESILVDGMRAAEMLKKKDPKAHRLLTEVETEAVYIDKVKGGHYISCGPILKYRKDTGEFVQLRFNLYDRAPLRTLPPTKIPEFYEALKKLTKEINSPQASWHFKLLPGTVVLFDNWRLLHGREEYTGKRLMNGCYIGHGDFESTARILALL